MEKAAYISPEIEIVALPDPLLTDLVGGSDRGQDGTLSETISTDNESGGGEEGSEVWGAKGWGYDPDWDDWDD